MVKKKFYVNNKEGFHLRPAGVLCNIAKNYDCSTTLIYNENPIECKNPIMIVAACIKSGSEYIIKCEGHQEKECLSAISKAEANDYKI